MHWHLPTLAAIHHISYTLVDDLVDGEPSPDVSPLLPILRVDPILHLEPSRRSNNTRMFSKRSHIKGNLALPFDLKQNMIHLVDKDHSLEDLSKLLCVILDLLVDQLAIQIESPECGHLVEAVLHSDLVRVDQLAVVEGHSGEQLRGAAGQFVD